MMFCCLVQATTLLAWSFGTWLIINKSFVFETYGADDYLTTGNFNTDQFRLDNYYITEFASIFNEIKLTDSISKTFQFYYVLFLLFQFFLCCTITSSINISLAFLLENSLNDQDIFWNYLIYMLASIIGFSNKKASEILIEEVIVQQRKN